MTRTAAALLAHLAPYVSCSFSSCQIFSWGALGRGLNREFDHDPKKTRRESIVSLSQKKSYFMLAKVLFMNNKLIFILKRKLKCSNNAKWKSSKMQCMKKGREKYS